MPKVKILAGLYKSSNYATEVWVHNYDDTPKQINVFDMLDAEINNFEEIPLKSNVQNNRICMEKIRHKNLNCEEKTKLFKLLNDFSDIFFNEDEELTFTSAIRHHINTQDDLPVYSKTYRYPFCHREEVQRQVDKMLTQGIIQHSDSPYNSPIWVVPKKLDASGKRKWRLVIDYRKLNNKTVDDKYPLPNITAIFGQTRQMPIFHHSGFGLRVPPHPD